ncbi:MAG: efflux RND transporter periplasmic adaptor subunit [Myxococcota bacterium]|nr:efflux RND transporter periplasmic adaptor subunit [Myxococcota bacterium]
MSAMQAAVGAVSTPSPKSTLLELISRERLRRRHRHLISWSAVAAVPILTVAVWLALRQRPVPLAARFHLVPVTEGDVLREVRATGHVEAVTMVQIGAETSGRIASVEVDYNDRVKQGQVLARFDRVALEAQLAQTQASAASARAALEQAKTERDRSARDLVRAQQLFDGKSLSETDRDNASATARLAEQRVAAADAQLAAQKAAHDLARTNLDHAVIHSPIDGIVITRNVDPGQTVASTLQTPVLFSVAADLRRMRVVAAVDEADIGEVAQRQQAFFVVNAYPDRVFDGIVTEVRNSPVVVQDVVTYGTVVEVANLDLALKPGMTASVRIRTATAKDALHVPSSALRFTPPGERPRDHAGVWVLEGLTLRRVDVRPGVSDGEITEIGRGVLAPGQNVLAELSSNLLSRTTALENVAMPLVYAGVPRRERTRRATESLPTVGLAGRESARQNELSGGQQQRVAIARAIVNEPEIILADEPTGNLDSKMGAEIMQILAGLNAERAITVLMVTHDASCAAYARRQVVFSDGRVVSDGPSTASS